MGKARNGVAKRQPKNDKRPVGKAKREKHAEDTARQPTVREDKRNDEMQLSDGEVKVLGIFRKYLMKPGQMLCLSNTDIASMDSVLENLTSAGMLVPDGNRGGYSLTRVGYETMKELA